MKVIDNFLNKDRYNHLKEVMFSDGVPWFLKQGTVDGKKEDLTWFSHCFYNENKPDSNLYSFMPDFLNKLNVASLLQIRANLSLTPPTDKFKTNAHIDYPYTNSKTAIFYFNTDTSGTIFYNKKEELIKAKENRMVVFNTNIKHCGYLTNKSNKRIVINFNYYEKN